MTFIERVEAFVSFLELPVLFFFVFKRNDCFVLCIAHLPKICVSFHTGSLLSCTAHVLKTSSSLTLTSHIGVHVTPSSQRFSARTIWIFKYIQLVLIVLGTFSSDLVLVFQVCVFSVLKKKKDFF